MSEKFKYTVGLHNVGSYQVAGSPYVTASTVSQDTETQIEFPNVTNNVTVKLDSAGGVTYDSIEMSGAFYFETQSKIYNHDGNNYSISCWVSSSGHAESNEQSLFSFGSRFGQCVREKNGQYQLFTRTVGGTALVTPQAIKTSGWEFVTFTVSGSETAVAGDINNKIYINSARTDNDITTDSTDARIQNTYPNGNGGKFLIGPLSGPFHGDTFKIRDLILWDGILEQADVNDIYNSGLYNDYTTGPSLTKLVWVKSNLINHGSGLVPVNYGTSGGEFHQRLFDSPDDTILVSSDSPFESEEGGGSGGELRIHYRSTGSLPNVEANKHYWTLSSQDEEIKMNVKTKEIYLSAVDGDCDFSLQADLTNIPASRMYQHTGSGVDE